MGRNPSRHCRSEARSTAQRRTIAGVAQAPHREIQNAPPGQVCRRPPAKNRHRKNAETRTAGGFLERQSHPRPRINFSPCAQWLLREAKQRRSRRTLFFYRTPVEQDAGATFCTLASPFRLAYIE